MTLEAVVSETVRRGIRLEARGDRLHVNAPKGTLTPELRDQLTQHKPALLTLLTTQFVQLRGGLTVPLPALLLALDLERRGVRMSLNGESQFQIEASPDLTEEDRAGIARWRLHLGAILNYQVPEVS